MTQGSWRERFSALIRDPIGQAIWQHRSLFDLRHMAGPREAVDRLVSHIAAEVSGRPVFVRILANDTLAQLPPLTFFEGCVIDLDGGSHAVLDVNTAAIQPIADAARVFALAAGDLPAAPARTVARLRAAARAFPGLAPVLLDAAEGFRVAAWLRHRAGRAGIEPNTLDRFEQGLLRGVFRSVQALLRLTSSHFELD